MGVRETYDIEEKTAPEEKTPRAGKTDRKANWILICWFCLLVGFILLYWVTRL
ncbi:MAG: hypothetical protein ACE5GL_04795 [Calditrichia bacterium]